MPGSSPDFADRLRTARERAGLTQADLATRAGLQPSAISHFESRRRSPSFENLRKLAVAVSVTTDYLLGRTESPTESVKMAGELFRKVDQLTDRDRELVEDFAELLLKKKRKEEKDEDRG